MERRELIRILSSTAGLACLQGLSPDDLLGLGKSVHADAAGQQGLQALDGQADATVIAAAERILPATDTPGATAAQVHRFIDRMLADWYTPAERDRFLSGLRELDERSRASHRRDFVGCTEAQQTALLTTLDGEVTALRGPAGAEARRRAGLANANEHWFATLKYLTAWGWATSEPVLRALGRDKLPGRWDGCAPYQPRAGAPRPS
ncbi:MAG: gluconate 2-dehydrogenase subunit 3 family protein [Gemmatimonadales bacterium]